MDMPPFSLAISHRKWEPFENHIFRMALVKKAMDGFFH